MEEEALKLKELQSEVDKQMSGVSNPLHSLDRSNSTTSNASLNVSYEEKVINNKFLPNQPYPPTLR